MKVKIGNKIFDSEVEPIMLILTDSDKLNIENMHTDKYKYISFPNGCDINKIREWSKLDDNITFGNNGRVYPRPPVSSPPPDRILKDGEQPRRPDNML